MILFLSITTAQPPTGDWLLYDDEARESPGITAYNPATGEKRELPVTGEMRNRKIETSGDGRIAYVQDNDVWVLDVLNDPYNPINITQTPNEQEWFLDWTPDGGLLEYMVGSEGGPYLLYIYDGNKVSAVDVGFNLARYWNENGWYLAFQGGNIREVRWYVQDDGRASYYKNLDGAGWYVWNGEKRIDLTLPTLPTESVWHTFEWTPDNHLFITVGYRIQKYDDIGPTDLFYWNGDAVYKVNPPLEAETFTHDEWSEDGRLTLYSINQDYFEQWYIWDGVSFTADGVPDTSTLIAINGSNERIHDMDWMPDGRLAIVAQGDSESETLLGHPFSCPDPCLAQLYLWDAQTLIQVTSYGFSSFLIDVHDSGNFALAYFDGIHIRGLTVFDSNLQLVFYLERAYRMVQWDSDGNFAYCGRDGLTVWNGENSIELDGGTYYAKWLLTPSRQMLCYRG